MNKIKICIDKKTMNNELGKKYIDIIEYVKKVYSFDLIENENLYNYELLKELYKEYDFVLIFNSNNNYKEIGNLIYYPIDIFNFRKEYLINNNFSDFAKSKSMYNELSNIYMELIANDTDKEINFIEGIYTKYNNDSRRKVIDFCCGVGRHVFGLSNKGFNVTGVDVSKNQIETAIKVHSIDNTKYFVGDSRNIKINDTFNMAMCMWTTYNYFSKDSELKEFIENVYNHLSDNGILILDTKNIPSLDKFRIYNRSKNNERIDLEQLIIKRILNDKIQNSQYFLFIKQDKKCKFVMDEEFVRFYSLEEIKNITNNKFEIINVYGSFDMDEYIEKSSERMIIVLRKIND